MLSHRNAHYWLWFLVFGIVSVVVGVVASTGLTSESVWLLATGFLGLLFGAGKLTGRFSRSYDLLVGLLFTIVGIIGVLHNLNITLLAPGSSLPGGVDSASLIGLSLSLPYAMIHTVLGLSSLNLGLRANSGVPVAAAPVSAT